MNHLKHLKLASVLLPLAFAGLYSTASLAADQALIDAAKKEGTVVWYTSLVQATAVRPVADAFEAKYPGIKVEAVGGGVTDLILKLTEEAKANSVHADVSHGGTAVGPLTAAGVIAPYSPDSAKNYPAELKDPGGLYTFEFTYYFGTSINTELVAAKDAPKSYQDLLDPKWKGKMAWTNVLTEGAGPGFIGLMIHLMGEEKGMAYLKQLAAQQIVSVAGNQRVVMDQVIAGQYPIGLMNFNHHAYISQQKQAPVKWLPLESSISTGDTIFLINKAPHPNAGKLFIDFVLSPEGQTVLQKAGYIPADPNVPAADAALKPATGNFKAWVLSPQETIAKLPGWVKIYNDLFK